MPPKSSASTNIASTPPVPSEPLLPPPAEMIPAKRGALVAGLQGTPAALRVARNNAVNAKDRVRQFMKTAKHTRDEIAKLLAHHDATPDAPKEWAETEKVDVNLVREFHDGLDGLVKKFLAGQA